MYQIEYIKGTWGWYWIIRKGKKIVARCNPDVYYKHKGAAKMAFRWMICDIAKNDQTILRRVCGFI